MDKPSNFVVERAAFPQLFAALDTRGYTIVGPTVRDGAIVYDALRGVDDLPIGWTDAQDGGVYRLARRADAALFGYNTSPHAWKKFLYPPAVRLTHARRENGAWRVMENDDAPPRYAFLGVRACDLAAIEIQDKVFLQGAYQDSIYAARREPAFILAVNCAQAGGTCFCASMGTGPRATQGFDLALTEILEAEQHYFLVQVGTERGAEVLNELAHRQATDEEMARAEKILLETAQHMGRTLDTRDLKALLYQNYEHPHWNAVAARCLACANCTLVCPTCFCSTMEDVTDLSGENAERWRKWDSCFTMDFSYIHGGSVRQTHRARYRQWLTHKLATWIDQFGTSGCVGCGRCITWCPVAIDLTAEVRALRDTETIKGA